MALQQPTDDCRTDPINYVDWLDVEKLRANAWNPNVVFRPELRLLEHSILETGWTFPILVSRDGLVIDGFHRWTLSRESKALRERYAGRVPCVVLDVDEPTAMLITVRMNRAKGTHVAVRMADLVQDLIDKHGLSEEQVAKGIGGTLDEVRLLYQDSIFKTRKLDEAPYSRAWVPRESRFDQKSGGPGGG